MGADPGTGWLEEGATLTASWTVREILSWTRGFFHSGGIAQPRLEAEILLAHTLDVERLHLYLTPDKPLTLEERARFRDFVKERRSGVPLQYIIGEVSFYGLRFQVGREALIPRSETEELIERALSLAPREQPIQCLDLGTGSGVIAVCLARFLPRATLTATDISEAALAMARRNAEMNGVADRIHFRRSDWFEDVEGCFDLVVSNPPYVERAALAGLASEITEHEPHVALDGGRDGTGCIAALADGLSTHLRAGGVVVIEIGDGQGARVVALFEQGGLADVSVERDLSGRERFVVGQWPS